jgi:hypothetical protein
MIVWKYGFKYIFRTEIINKQRTQYVKKGWTFVFFACIDNDCISVHGMRRKCIFEFGNKA